MIKVTGKYNTATVYAKAVEMKCEDQILQYLNHPMFADTKVRIMPDVHLAKGATVGFTATCNEYVVPSIIGVDIGCGVNAYSLGAGSTAFDKLDKYIRKRIPSGREVNPSAHEWLEETYKYVPDPRMTFDSFMKNVANISKKVEFPVGRALGALGSLGGGNHFIEIDTDKHKGRWLLVHTGSRGFGLHVSKYHQELADKRTNKESPLKFLTGPAADNYIADMKIAQLYARVNRALIAFQIGCDFFKLAHSKFKAVESIHNYIDFEHGIIRKGAISAQKGEQLVIPFSMADGAIIGVGKGNAEWNYSAPHGSGRKMSRTQAKELSMDEYRKRMKGIWSACVTENTVDESPMAYKSARDVLDFVEETLHITHRLTPIYNFKAEE
ncbi:MAG: RtcB family protein [Holosporaceae bacterium]|jgi:RNA-splicing ligase RtcB|nr:RtcB family protein [Holosporaceae bacterium]